MMYVLDEEVLGDEKGRGRKSKTAGWIHADTLTHNRYDC
jgi:hypothetical protein